jgi:hypothetical protein
MDFEFRDYLSSAAIVISIASFAVATRTATFNRRSKAAELRAQVLMKFAEARNEAINVRSVYERLVEKMQGDEECERFEELHARISRLADMLEESYNNITKLPADSGVDAYERFFHAAHDIRGQLIDLKVEIEKNGI